MSRGEASEFSIADLRLPIEGGSRAVARTNRKSKIANLKFTRYFTSKGWVHALLLVSIWLFLFPFFWMLATSVKTDEELTESSVLPEFVTFRPDSPYVRRVVEPTKPTDVTNAQWAAMLPKLTELASAGVGQYQTSHPPLPSVGAFDADQHRRAAANLLVNAAVAKLNRRLWGGSEAALLEEYR